MATVKIHTYNLKVIKTITLRTVKTFGNYIHVGVILMQYTCHSNSQLQISFGFHLLSVSIHTFKLKYMSNNLKPMLYQMAKMLTKDVMIFISNKK